MTEKKEEKKEKKKQGPVRTGAVVPFIVFVILVVTFNIFLLDSTIKKTIEFAGGKVNGAEVNVGSVQSSFSSLSIIVSNIQFTNKNKPEENLFKVDSLQFNLLWDGILRGKGVIELANINGILLNSPRKSAGEVYADDFDEKTGNHKVTQKAFEKVEKEFEGNVFGDVAGVLAGGSTGDVTSNIEQTLESKKRFEKLQEEIKVAEKKFQTDMKNLPSDKELKELNSRFNKIKWKDLSNLLKAPKIIQQADKLKRDIDKAVKAYDTANKNTQNSINSLNKSYKEAESLISKDLKSVSKRMNLPKLDQKSIARMIFGPEVLEKVKEAKKYQSMAEEYMPPKKEKPAPIKESRGKGRNYQFGTPNSYPMFWLKRANISSKNEQGEIKGLIQNVTNDQVAIGKLTRIDIKGDFPPLNIRKVFGNIVIDHREDPLAQVDAGIGSFIVKDKALSNSKEVKFEIKQSAVKTKIKGYLRPESIDLDIDNRFGKIVYYSKAESKALDEVLKDVAKKTKVLTLDARARGKWDSINFDVKSNLAKAIENSVQSLVKEKIEATQRKIRQDIERQISGARANVDNQMAKLKSDANKQMAQAKGEFNKIKGRIKQEEKKAKKSVKNPFKGIKL